MKAKSKLQLDYNTLLGEFDRQRGLNYDLQLRLAAAHLSNVQGARALLATTLSELASKHQDDDSWLAYNRVVEKAHAMNIHLSSCAEGLQF